MKSVFENVFLIKKVVKNLLVEIYQYSQFFNNFFFLTFHMLNIDNFHYCV